MGDKSPERYMVKASFWHCYFSWFLFRGKGSNDFLFGLAPAYE